MAQLRAEQATLDAVILTPLQQLLLLTELSLDGCPLHEVTVLTLASLSSLTKLNVDDGKNCTPQLLRLLVDPAHCKLQRLTCLELQECRHVTAADLQTLAQLPALSTLTFRDLAADALPYLQSLSSMASLELRMERADDREMTPATTAPRRMQAAQQLAHTLTTATSSRQTCARSPLLCRSWARSIWTTASCPRWTS